MFKKVLEKVSSVVESNNEVRREGIQSADSRSPGMSLGSVSQNSPVYFAVTAPLLIASQVLIGLCTRGN